MNAVVKSETYRLKKSKEMKIMAGILLGCTALKVILALVIQHLHLFQNLVTVDDPAGFFDGFASTALDSTFGLLMIIMTASLVTKLYQSGVNKQLVSAGISRKQIILGEFAAYVKAFCITAVLAAVAAGIGNMILGGSLGLEGVNPVRLGLSIAGMLLIVANMSALCLLISHITGSQGAAIALGFVIVMVLPSAHIGVSLLPKLNFLNSLFLDSIQANVVSLTGSIGTQLLNMGALAAVTALFLVLCQAVFEKKEIK